MYAYCTYVRNIRTCVCVYIHIYTYIYIARERGGDSGYLNDTMLVYLYWQVKVCIFLKSNAIFHHQL